MVYAEDVFLLNTAMNYAILLLTSRIAKTRIKHWKIIVGACLGGVYAVLMFVPTLTWAYTFLGKFVFALITVFIVFGIRSRREFAKLILVFYFVTFAMAGAAYGIVSLLGMTGDTFPLQFLAITTIISYAAIMLITKNYRLKSRLQKQTATLKITYDKHEIEVDCLEDTGNELAIAVVEFSQQTESQIKEILPEKFCESYEKCADNDYLAIAELIEEWKDKLKLRIVPFNSLGKSGGMLLALKVEKLQFAGETLDKSIVGLYKGKLTPTDIYQAIV